MDTIEKSLRLTIILESRAEDDRYLQARGIGELVQAERMGWASLLHDCKEVASPIAVHG